MRVKPAKKRIRVKPVRRRRVPRKRKNPCKVHNGTVIQMGGDRNCVNITLHKTVRIPDDNRTYSLPPSLGTFQVYKVDDYWDRVPASWRRTGGLFVPMYQREAMWMKFDCIGLNKKHALKVGVGKINAVSGGHWTNRLQRTTNDYLTLPSQPWLDGIATGRKTIKQFVAMRLGEGYTVEAQKTGKETFGGIQLVSYNPKRRRSAIRRVNRIHLPRRIPTVHHHHYHHQHQHPQPRNVNWRKCSGVKKKKSRSTSHSFYSQSESARGRRSVRSSVVDHYGDEASEMGMGCGGKMVQKVYRDTVGYYKWDQTKCSRVFIHLVNSEMFTQITGLPAPTSTITRATYQSYGYPYLNWYDEKRTSGVGGSWRWNNVQSVDEIDDIKPIYHPPPPPVHYNPHNHGLRFQQNNTVRDGNCILI